MKAHFDIFVKVAATAALLLTPALGQVQTSQAECEGFTLRQKAVSMPAPRSATVDFSGSGGHLDPTPILETQIQLLAKTCVVVTFSAQADPQDNHIIFQASANNIPMSGHAIFPTLLRRRFTHVVLYVLRDSWPRNTHVAHPVCWMLQSGWEFGNRAEWGDERTFLASADLREWLPRRRRSLTFVSVYARPFIASSILIIACNRLPRKNMPMINHACECGSGPAIDDRRLSDFFKFSPVGNSLVNTGKCVSHDCKDQYVSIFHLR